MHQWPMLADHRHNMNKIHVAIVGECTRMARQMDRLTNEWDHFYIPTLGLGEEKTDLLMEVVY